VSESLTTYNQKWPKQATQLDIELSCFRRSWPKEKGGLGQYGHLCNAIKIIWPGLIWHDWLHRTLLSLCTYKTNAFTGCGSASKTFNAGLFGLVFWLADPGNTTVIFTSTTGKMVRKRIWPVIQKLYANYPDCPGNMIDSKTALQASKGDDKHGIFALAVREGPTQKAVADIQGMHAERILIVIDEGTDTPEAILEAIPNLRKGCSDFRVVIIGNASSKLDPHGRLSEPVDGWGNITVEDEEWETKGVAEWEIDPGIALHFDGTKSPNVMAGEDKWPFLFTNDDLKRAMKAPFAEETIGFWKFTRGFWPPEGIRNTVFSEPDIERYKLKETFTFLSSRKRLAALDPGFGGDDCTVRTGSIGDLHDGRTAIQLEKTHYLVIRISATDPVEDQIVRQTRKICEDEGIPPNHLGIDSSFRGGTLAIAFSRDWSSQVQCIECGGSPSDNLVTQEDSEAAKPAKEVYDRFITELWFNVREFAVHGLMGGMDLIELRQFCRRSFESKGRPPKLILETKKEYKVKNGSQSPNEADATAILVAVAKRLGATATGGTLTDSARNWLAIALEKDAINVNDEEEHENHESYQNEDLFDLQGI